MWSIARVIFKVRGFFGLMIGLIVSAFQVDTKSYGIEDNIIFTQGKSWQCVSKLLSYSYECMCLCMRIYFH